MTSYGMLFLDGQMCTYVRRSELSLNGIGLEKKKAIFCTPSSSSSTPPAKLELTETLPSASRASLV
jgi:hypothetical protein